VPSITEDLRAVVSDLLPVKAVTYAICHESVTFIKTSVGHTRRSL
jgi:hypothetical protein